MRNCRRAPGSGAAREKLNMNTLTDLIDRYIAAWNETDASRRRDLIARTWAENGSYLDPMLQGEGRDGIDAMIATVQERFPAHRFRRIGDVESHHDRVRFSWEFAPNGGTVVAKGTDFGVVTLNQLAAVTGFFDPVQPH
jgi:hypothetical protein